MKKKIIKTLLVSLIAIGIFTGISSNVTKEVKAATDPSAAPGDWAFTAESVSLHDAILSAYPTIDQAPNGNGDGFISKEEAENWSGTSITITSQVTGKIDGIENFKNIKILSIVNNQLTGSLPENIGNMESLQVLQLYNNELSGSIPTSLGSLSNLTHLHLHRNQLTGPIPNSIGYLANLVDLQLYNNQLTGSIPSSIGNLNNLTQIFLYNNQLTGVIPDSIGNLSNLKILQLQGNNLSGEIPASLGNLSNLINLALYENNQLTGNPVEIFKNHTKLEYLNISETNLIQASPDIPSLVTFIYDDLSELLLSVDKTGPAEGLTQEDINKAQESADWISDPAEKQQWQDNIDLAQNMLDAQNSVLDLLNDTKTDIQETTTQTSIDDAQALVTALPDGQYKTDLQAEIDLAQEYLDNRLAAQAKVEDLFTDSNHVDIKDTTNQAAIDDAQVAVTALPDSVFKDALQVEIDKAQAMLDAKGVVEDLFTDSKHIDINDTTDQAAIDNTRNVVSQLPDGELKTELNKEIDKAQDMLNAKNKVHGLFTDGTHTNIIDGLTQGNVDDAQTAVDKLPSGDLKDELQKEIDKAQDMLDAKNKVDNLFTDDTHTNITDGLTQKDIDKAQDAVDKLPNGDLKDALQKEIDKAQDMLNARDAVNDLLDKDGNLNSGVTQKEIDKAQDLVNKLPDGDLKTELQAIIDEAQKQLDAQNKNNPSIAPTVDASSSVGGKSVNTSDATNLSLYGGLLILSLGGLVVFMKKREME
ncbi:toxin Cry1Ac domain D-VI-related protein [Breznakia pachnodae]|uniref:Cell division FtsZ-interacting protein ZapD n=1 Tax=Breznakia pachnodae TaxID=265178 RepID=A0ABU0E278_9FIRM|nr:toxin Cry1Ac domain D-VI-related protein [Breznakia pachnodae]MDQ0360926.1 cell division FtsZ-interacting protein ZapD [Breznakia pachnodae]